MESWAATKKLYASVAVPPAPVGFLTKGHLPRLSRRQSANNKSDNEMILGSVHKSPEICLTAEENPGKPLLEDRLMKAVRPVIASNGSHTSK